MKAKAPVHQVSHVNCKLRYFRAASTPIGRSVMRGPPRSVGRAFLCPPFGTMGWHGDLRQNLCNAVARQAFGGTGSTEDPLDHGDSDRLSWPLGEHREAMMPRSIGGEPDRLALIDRVPRVARRQVAVKREPSPLRVFSSAIRSSIRTCSAPFVLYDRRMRARPPGSRSLYARARLGFRCCGGSR